MKNLVLVLLCMAWGLNKFCKDGGTKQDFYKSKTDCRVAIHQADMEGPRVREDFLSECMTGYGWEPKTEAGAHQ